MTTDGERGVPATHGQSRAGESAHLGPRKLTTLHAVGQALAIGPVFSVGLVSGLVANVAGYSTPLSILLGSIGSPGLGGVGAKGGGFSPPLSILLGSMGSLGLAYVVAISARRFAGAGAIFEYLSQAGHNSFGLFLSGV